MADNEKSEPGMTRQARMVDVFLSTPSDVDAERIFIKQAAHDWNVLRARATGCHINILTWEDAVAPALSDRPQSVVNEAVGDDYDVYLGVMWGRFGTPTGAADSGTVEEFDRALDRYRHGENLRLAMLFKTTPIPTAQLSGVQFDKVQDFKERFSKEGGFYSEFDDDEMLRKILNRLFEEIAESHGGPTGSGPPSSQVVASTETTRDSDVDESGGIATVSKFEDIGFFEVSEKLVQVAADQASFFERLTKKNRETTERVRNANSEMQTLVSFGQATAGALRGPIDEITEAMDGASSFLEENLPSFNLKNDELVELTDAGFDIATDFSGHAAGGDQFRLAVEQIVLTLEQQRVVVEETVQIVKSLPRMTTAFNRAKRRQVENQSELIRVLERLRIRLKETLDKYPMEALV